MYYDNKIWIAKGDKPIYLLPEMADRHGLIAGAPGTGKTATLKVMAESFSDMGVPVFITDIKGDLAGLAAPGSDSPDVEERLEKLRIEDFKYKAYPVRFWDVFGEKGHRVRITVLEMGALLLARLLGLNYIQAEVLNMIFRIADDMGLLLLDLKDLGAMLKYAGDNAKKYNLQYGNISSQSIGAILRSLIALEDQGCADFFGEASLDISDWIQTAEDGRGYINILHSTELFRRPQLYSSLLLWLMSELFETLPEKGDTGKPKAVFFFDEAQLLFENVPGVLLQRIEQVVRLIGSKGVGLYFVTQNPMDLPQDILGQLGNRIQHALHAYTLTEQKRVRAAVEIFRPNPSFDSGKVITELGVGEALVSCLDSCGSTGIVERAFILPPQSRLGTIDDDLRRRLVGSSAMGSKYDKAVDRESAYEMLKSKLSREQAAEQEEQKRPEREKQLKESGRRSYSRKPALERMADTAISAIGRELGRTLIRGLLGSLKK